MKDFIYSSDKAISYPEINLQKVCKTFTGEIVNCYQRT